MRIFFFLKNPIALGDIAFRNMLLFLKIVTKWRQSHKSRLNNPLTNRAFQKLFSHLFLSRHPFSKLPIC